MLKTFCIDNETVQSCPETNATIFVHVPPDAAETARQAGEVSADLLWVDALWDRVQS